MATLADVYRELNALRDDGIIGGYAVTGAMGALFYLEAVRTYDVTCSRSFHRRQ